MTLDRSELRRLAAAATLGPWVACAHVAGTDSKCPCGYRGDVASEATDEMLFQMGAGPDPADEEEMWRSIKAPSREQGFANGRYIAAANPQRLLALLDENDRLREALQRLVLVALPVWEERIVDNYLRREGYAAIALARAALESSEGTDETPPKGIR